MESTSTESDINFISVQSPLDWDEYFMLQAMTAAFRSKDPVTKVGCVLVNNSNHQLSMGYNGFVAGIDEDQLPWGKDTSVGPEFQKYSYVIHAEANAILQTERSLMGARCYVTLFPCNECAKLLASKKIGEIIYYSNKHQDKISTKISQKIFDLANIHYRILRISPDLIDRLNIHINAL